MTLLHQAAQKAVEALTDILGVEVMAPEGGREEVQEIHCIARAALASLESALQQQEVPSDKQIARAFADEQMRQGSGTHNRHEWFRRGALWAASPSTTQQHEVGSELVIGSSGSDWIAVGGFRFDRDAGWQQVAAEYANNPDVTTLYRKRSERATAPCTPENAEKDTSNGAGGECG